MLPRLDFDGRLNREQKWPWDLAIFLYRHSGKSAKAHRRKDIQSGVYGSPRLKRVPLLVAIWQKLADALAAGASHHTFDTKIRSLLPFYAFCDEIGEDPTPSTPELIALIDTWLRHEQRTGVQGRGYSTTISAIGLLASAVGLTTYDFTKRVPMPIQITPRRYTNVDESVSQADLLAFAKCLLSIIDSLSLEQTTGGLPVVIRLGEGLTHYEYCGHYFPQKRQQRELSYEGMLYRRRHDEWLKTPQPLSERPMVVNLRIEAELLLFIAQTGINLSVAANYQIDDFRYSSHLDGYSVQRRYKNRRGGEVAFQIYSEYRPHFEKYLAWRKFSLVDASDTRLFPFIQTKRPLRIGFQRIRKLIRPAGIPFVSPLKLRGFRVNWLLAKSGDASLVASLAQHSVSTLLHTYNRPGYRKAAVAITRFWRRTDPTLTPPAPGRCVNPNSEPSPDIPLGATQPDCVSPSGCLFCIHHRDVGSLDYVWSLLSYRYLKSIELSRDRGIARRTNPSAAHLTIDRITQKVDLMELRDSLRPYVLEAKTRIREENYHPDWADLIELSEAS